MRIRDIDDDESYFDVAQICLIGHVVNWSSWCRVSPPSVGLFASISRLTTRRLALTI